jgi:hypothetical protein
MRRTALIVIAALLFGVGFCPPLNSGATEPAQEAATFDAAALQAAALQTSSYSDLGGFARSLWSYVCLATLGPAAIEFEPAARDSNSTWSRIKELFRQGNDKYNG